MSHLMPGLYKYSFVAGTLQSRSSSSRSSFGGLASSFFQRVFAWAASTSGKTRSKTSEYHETGLPSIPSLMFCKGYMLAFVQKCSEYLL